ncbi:MAG: 8-oxo-dGTP diphosphatase MutT, partial [Hydrogenovibrio sp.]|nr:8-oxo-dGTP diphosphatase MutT [Hydrogenovibrio sp.]
MARLQIVVGVLKKQNQVLLSLRQKHQAYADFWEFPGGKVESGESFEQALQREFEEEVGVHTANWQPLITIPWDYEHASVSLNVFVSEDFEGEPVGMEGQQIAWVDTDSLSEYHFPEANQGIVRALCLPHEYMISGGFHDAKDGLHRLETALKEGVRLVQLRAKNLEEEAFLAFAKPAIALV